MKPDGRTSKMILNMLTSLLNGLSVCYVSNTHQHSRDVMRKAVNALKGLEIDYFTVTKDEIKSKNGGSIKFSDSNRDKLRGLTLDYIYEDEWR